MRYAVWWMLALALVHCASRPSRTQRPANDRASVVAFVGVTVVPCDRDRVIEDQTVVVRDGRIIALGPSATLPVPDSAARIDGRGKFLMPGLSEMHGHLPDANFPEQMLQLPLFVANGVTTVRGMAGAPNHLVLREQIARGEVLGPRLVVYGPAMNGRSSPTPAIAIEQVRRFKAVGYDGIKVHPGLSRETYDAIASEAKRLHIPFGGHVPHAVGIERALAAGQKSIEHLDGS